MNAISFASAYKQLRPAEKVYVDGYVQAIERDYAARGERISNALYKAISEDVIAASRGFLDKPLVRAAITERINSIAADSELTVHRVIKELMGVAFCSIGDYMEIGEDGQPYFNLGKCTPEQLAAIQSVEVEETATRSGINRKFKFKLFDKLAGIDKLARYMGLLEADNPFWKADSARPVGPHTIAAATTTEAAADQYARMING